MPILFSIQYFYFLSKKTAKIFLFCLIVNNNFLYAQKSVSFEAGQIFSKFSFYGSDLNRTNDFDYNIGNSYSLDYHFVSQEGVFIRSGMGIFKAGATSTYKGKPTIWELNYLNGSIGVGYIYSKFRFMPYVSVVHYFAILQNAWQKIGSDNFDMKKNNVINNLDYGVFLVPGLKVALSDQIAVYTEYKQMFGLANIEKTPGQKLYNRGFILNIGLAVNISKQESKE